MVALPDLWAPVFWVHETVAEPGPEPLAGETVIQEPLPDVVQSPPTQLAGRPVIVTSCEPAGYSGLAEVGAIEKLVHTGGGAAPWVTGKVLPATVALPDLWAPVFWVHETVADPGPEPLAGETVIQEPLPDVVQSPPTQLAGRPVIVTSCEPAGYSGLAEVGAIEKLVHTGGGAAAWVTGKVLPAMVALPDLWAPVFWVHETVAEPGPDPLAGETVIQEPLPEAVQPPPTQLAGRPVIVTSCEPAGYSGLAEVGAIEKLVHTGGGAAPWVTGKVLPARVALPDLWAPVFGSTRRWPSRSPTRWPARP